MNTPYFFNRHFKNYQKKETFQFICLISLELVIASLLISSRLLFFLPELENTQKYQNLPWFFILVIAILIAPIFETFFLQSAPFGLQKN
ncbi:hypothetical protein [Undibacterium sp. Xuan67W]|uniref:hypothetical protein n=1 Tax=Undibacterium sp. Xuan67W TaxID=3413057 RepID=UPI003BF054EC